MTPITTATLLNNVQILCMCVFDIKNYLQYQRYKIEIVINIAHIV